MSKIGRPIDLTGQRFSRLQVIERDYDVDSSKGIHWVCKCDCGNIKTIGSYSLRSGATKSCGCLNREIITGQKKIADMSGQRYGCLTILKRVQNHITPSGQQKVMWQCRCDCGNVVNVASQDLKTGHTKSCGCIPKKQRGSGLIDLTGKKFGELIVVERAEDYTYTNKCDGKTSSIPRWLCKCSCGNDVIVQGGNLRSGIVTNCGCKKITSVGEKKIFDYLRAHNIKFKIEYYYDDLRNKSGNLLRFDFALLDDINNVILLIEYQGKQHYIDYTEFGLYQRQYSDQAKRDYCQKNNILLYEIRYDEDINTSLSSILNENNLLN